MGQILKPREAADYLGIPAATLSSWRYQDRGRIHMGEKPAGPAWVDNPTRRRCRGYRIEALDAWLDRQEIQA